MRYLLANWRQQAAVFCARPEDLLPVAHIGFSEGPIARQKLSTRSHEYGCKLRVPIDSMVSKILPSGLALHGQSL